MRAVLDNSGSITSAIAYDAFGNVTSGSPPDRFGYAMMQRDAITLLSSAGNGTRDYHPETGKWQQLDPMRFAAGDSNLYGYVQNDAANYNDPSGLDRSRTDGGQVLYWQTQYWTASFWPWNSPYLKNGDKFAIGAVDGDHVKINFGGIRATVLRTQLDAFLDKVHLGAMGQSHLEDALRDFVAAYNKHGSNAWDDSNEIHLRNRAVNGYMSLVHQYVESIRSLTDRAIQNDLAQLEQRLLIRDSETQLRRAMEHQALLSRDVSAWSPAAQANHAQRLAHVQGLIDQTSAQIRSHQAIARQAFINASELRSQRERELDLLQFATNRIATLDAESARIAQTALRDASRFVDLGYFGQAFLFAGRSVASVWNSFWQQARSEDPIDRVLLLSSFVYPGRTFLVQAFRSFIQRDYEGAISSTNMALGLGALGKLPPFLMRTTPRLGYTGSGNPLGISGGPSRIAPAARAGSVTHSPDWRSVNWSETNSRYGIVPRNAATPAEASIKDVLKNGWIPGEKGVVLTDRTILWDDLWELTQMTKGVWPEYPHGIEFGLGYARAADGTIVRKLYSGTGVSVVWPEEVVRKAAHVHPSGIGKASASDITAWRKDFATLRGLDPNAPLPPAYIIYGPAKDGKNVLVVPSTTILGGP